ncbi:ion transporter [bacterium]|nr:ion transporter [bacterium]
MAVTRGHPTGWRNRLHVIIFGAETRAGKAFDLGLIASIVASVIAVMLDSVASIHNQYGFQLRVVEWFFTIAFSIEYLLRIISVRRPSRYIFSFYGLVDLLAILPTYIAVIFPASHYLLVIRALRILRVFRVLKLVLYLKEGTIILTALRNSHRKITVFLFAVVTLVMIIGSLMYLIEGAENGFTSIPTSIYWTIVTLTTVGYGDIAPQTVLGKVFASIVMILGYAIIAVPTGIVTAEMALSTRGSRDEVSTQACPACGRDGHESDAGFCKFCGQRL